MSHLGIITLSSEAKIIQTFRLLYLLPYFKHLSVESLSRYVNITKCVFDTNEWLINIYALKRNVYFLWII